MAVRADKISLGPSRRELKIEDYYAGIIAGNITVLARALTLMESDNAIHRNLAEELLTRLLPNTGQSIRVGITGAPGVGKSTFIETLGLQLVDCGMRVAVLAVDPSSGISGGSILGDKTRMPELSAKPEAYIRPSPSTGTLGGVASRTRESLLVCEAAGYQVVLIETVGVGQSETMVADMTDCFLALMLPGAGDELQGIKRGLLELVDVIVVNKADGETLSAAKLAAHQYEAVVKSSSGRSPHSKPPKVLTCGALKREGVEMVWEAINACYSQQLENDSLQERRSQQNLRWLWSLVEQQLLNAIHNNTKVRKMRNAIERDVAAGVIPPAVAARKILEVFGPTIQ